MKNKSKVQQWIIITFTIILIIFACTVLVSIKNKENILIMKLSIEQFSDSLVQTYEAVTSTTEYPRDHNVSCNELYTIPEIDDILESNNDSLKLLQEKLLRCENNIQSCSMYGKCKETNYQKHYIRIGNSIIKWSVLKRCKEQEKGDILFSFTSGCEAGALEEYLEYINKDKRQLLFGIPIRWYNY